MTRMLRTALLGSALLMGLSAPAAAQEWLCDSSYQDCRAPLITLIRNETVGIDVAFWFMEDARLSSELIKRWQAGVPVRVIIDQRAFPSMGGDHPADADIVKSLVDAGIPIRQRALSNSYILHWKMMLFSGQNQLEFSGANYSPTAFVPQTPYVDFEDEAIYFTDDPSVVNSFRTKYDDLWVDYTNYSDYANITSTPVRLYPIYTKDPALNFPQQESYANRLLGRYTKEMSKLDVIMFRITDERETNAAISTLQRGIPVRLISDTDEYRDPSRQWVSYNLDKLWAAGVSVRVRAHAGLNHQKLVLFYSQGMSIFGSSNWTTPSDNRQQEHNYFTTKSWIFSWFTSQFERKWCSGTFAAGMPAECAGKQNPVGSNETTDFVPLPPDRPVNTSPLNASAGIGTSSIKLKWNGGYFAHFYDIYFGTDPNPPLYQANVQLGPTDYKTGASQSLTLPTLLTGTTYYWRIVGRTMAGLTANGPVWNFTTAGTPPPPPPPPPGATTQVIWASDVQSTNIFGRWSKVVDPTTAGGYALWNKDKGNAKISPPLSAPTSYFEATFDALSGVPYHIWIRIRAQNNSLSNNSVSAQFSDSVDSFGSPFYRIGSTSGAEILLWHTPLSGWGWADNSYTTFGADIYFATSGTHTIRIQQRADGAVVDQIVLSPDTYVRSAPGPDRYDTTLLPSTMSGPPHTLSPLPSPWTSQDVGIVGINGLAGVDGSTSLIKAISGGGDVWGTADGMYFVSQPLSGDGSLVVKVASVQKSATWSRAGLMIRESMAPNSANAFVFLTGTKSIGFQRRRATGASTFSTLTLTGVSFPRWLRLDRSGNVFTAYASSNGSTWSWIGSDSVPMGANAIAGLAGTSASVTATSTAAFDNLTLTPGTPTPAATPPPAPVLPPGWASEDIGNVGFTGTTTYDSGTGTFTLKGAGADVWGTADAFQFAYRAWIGDGSIVARVRSVQKISTGTKAGVMIRNTLDAGSAHAFMVVTPSKGVMFQRRTSAGGSSTSTAGSASTAPVWVRLVRAGSTITGYESADGVTWTLVGTDTIPMGATVYVGLGVVSKDPLNTATGLFDSVVAK